MARQTARAVLTRSERHEPLSGRVEAAHDARPPPICTIGVDENPGIQALGTAAPDWPPKAMVRVVLDNHSAHISKETMVHLSRRPGRFAYAHTPKPKHGSWPNLVKSAF